MQIYLVTRNDESIFLTAHDSFGLLLGCPGGELLEVGEKLGIEVASLQEVADVPSRRVYQSVERMDAKVTQLIAELNDVAIEVQPYFLGPGEAAEALTGGLPTLLDALKVARERGFEEVALSGFL